MSVPRVDVVVLGADARAVDGAACAAALDAGPWALVVGGSWGGTLRAPASRAARDLAARIAPLGLPAVACGRLVRVGLPFGAADVLDLLGGLVAGAAAPVVVALPGPRPPDLEPLIAAAARVIVVAPQTSALAACARAELGDRGRIVAPADRIRGLTLRAGLPWPGGGDDGDAGDDGQAAQFVLALMAAFVIGAAALALLAGGLRDHADHQRAADLGALAGARALLDARPRALGAGPRQVDALDRAAYLKLARQVALATARANGATQVRVAFGAGGLPDRVRVTVRDPIVVAGTASLRSSATAVAELSPWPGPDIAGDYPGPFALRDGKPLRPDAALAYDRLARAAQAAGHPLTVASGFRSSAEQAQLFAARPDPTWVAPPGQSLHRLGTELDLGPASAYGWIGANAERFGFVRRYAWEPWHVGLRANAGSATLGYGASGVPAFVPAAYRGVVARAASRHQVGAALLAAQIQQESGFDPRAVSSAGALGIAQFLPGTASIYGLADPFDPAGAIDAQARLMHDLLRRFGSVPLALAAYNAGPGAVAACGCIPPITETQAYVTRILALLGGGGTSGPPVRLIE